MHDSHPGDAATDEVLLDLVRNGGREAFADIFRTYRPMAESIARQYAVHGEVEDVVNDVFASILDQLLRGGGPLSNLRGYVATCVRREALRRARHHRATRPTADEKVLDCAVPFGDGRSDMGELEQVAKAMVVLPPRQREVIWALDVEGYAPRDLAGGLGMRPNSVSALAYRARKSVARAYLTEEPLV